MYIYYVSIETQQLDSNMQYLVYENHSKFIKASETIKEVSRMFADVMFHPLKDER